MPVMGVQCPLSARCTSRISCASTGPRVTTAVIPGSHISRCPISLRISTTNSGIGTRSPYGDAAASVRQGVDQGLLQVPHPEVDVVGLTARVVVGERLPVLL